MASPIMRLVGDQLSLRQYSSCQDQSKVPMNQTFPSPLPVGANEHTVAGARSDQRSTREGQHDTERLSFETLDRLSRAMTARFTHGLGMNTPPWVSGNSAACYRLPLFRRSFWGMSNKLNW